MISILETNGERAYNITEFLADSIADLENIPKVHAGDLVYIIETKEWKILSSDKMWQPLVDDIFLEEDIGG
jgi:hypothetical protein